MSEASNSRSLQQVYKITVFDALETSLPACFVIVHFTHAARQLMARRGQDVLLEARKIAKRLAFLPAQPRQVGMELSDTFADVDTLGPPTGYPDNSGSMAWVNYDNNAQRGPA